MDAEYYGTPTDSSAEDCAPQQFPSYLGSFMPNPYCGALVSDFVKSFFAAFDSATRLKQASFLDALMAFYSETARFSLCSVHKDSRGIMRSNGRTACADPMKIRQTFSSHFTNTQHDFENATYDVSYVGTESPAWICLNCNGTVVRNGREETFMRTFLLTKPEDRENLQVWSDMVTFVDSEPTHAPPVDKFPMKFGVIEDSSALEDFTSDGPPQKKIKSQQGGSVDDPCQLGDECALFNGKHPTSYLLEVCQGKGWDRDVSFEEEAVGGPSHEPWYQYVVHLKDRMFPAGQGKNKKEAKKNAARIALEILAPEIGLSVSSGADSEILDDQSGMDSVDPIEEEKTNTRGFGSSPVERVPAGAVSYVKVKTVEEVAAEEEAEERRWEEMVSEETRNLIQETGKNPISIVNEHAQKNQLPKPDFEDLPPDSDHPERKIGFWVRMKIKDKVYPTAGGKNKKQARTRAGSLALDELVRTRKLYQPNHRVLAPKTVKQSSIPKGSVFGDISTEIHDLFKSFCKENPLYVDSGKILAGIVMRDEKRHEAYILSLATGNRCIRGDKLSTDGKVLNDCHAEILARRGFVRFLYSQVQDYLEKKPYTIFESSQKKVLKVRERFTFHLYINTAPCGDGRVFTLSEPDEGTKFNPPEVSMHRPLYTDPKKHGVLRTKIEKGEGTIPVMDYADIQTMDGIGSGERLRTMSCSDKILKWNVLGLQGALLARYIETVYLTTITIGTLSHHGHLTRAICCRAGEISELPTGFFVNHPMLGLGEFGSDSRSIAKSTPMSISWTFSDQSIEQIDGTKGTLMNYSGDSSRLCKRHMFQQFKTTASMVGDLHTKSLYYYEAKADSKSYQKAKGVFFDFCAKMGYGTWLGKPKEEKCFR